MSADACAGCVALTREVERLRGQLRQALADGEDAERYMRAEMREMQQEWEADHDR